MSNVKPSFLTSWRPGCERAVLMVVENDDNPETTDYSRSVMSGAIT
jgi:hypothetical protein